MPGVFENMQFSAKVYKASKENMLDAPNGWTLKDWVPDRFNGFSAGYFVSDSGNDIVIAYTGTNDRVADPLNWTAGLGLPVPQIFDALDYYFEVRQKYPEATNISFTGHSLGGGLASLMAVFLDRPAMVFDQAPFQLAAISPAVIAKLSDYYIYNEPALNEFLVSLGTLALSRENNVTQYYIEGEILSALRFSASTLVGNDIPIPMGSSAAGPVERHSMVLMTAMQASPDFANAVRGLHDLVPLIFDESLFAQDKKSAKEDILLNMLRHQLGVKGEVVQDDMLNRFSSDMNTLIQADAYKTSIDLGKALIAFALERYYKETNETPDKQKQLFDIVTGGIQFDSSRVNPEIQSAKGYQQYFSTYLEAAFPSSQERQVIQQRISDLKDWSVATGLSGMSAADTENRGAFMLGGVGDDLLTGGEAEDLLVGGQGGDTLHGQDGDDILIAGEGTDRLEGGEGYDKYYVDNQDTIKDKDGKGGVFLDGLRLSLATRKQGEEVYRDGRGNTFRYTEPSDGNKGHLVVNGSLNIEEYTNGDLGIVLVEKPEPDDPMEEVRDKTREASKQASPVILDLDGDGVETTTIENRTHFDHAADGFAEETGWVGQDDGLLVRDLDGNGMIDSGRELFGSETQLANGDKAANGFEALKELDNNHDGVIDALDAAFTELRVWQDANGDGRTDAGELLTLDEANVQSINLAYSNANTLDPQGNTHKQLGSYTATDGQTRQATDVWLKTDPLYSIATEQVEIPADIAALPIAKGYGTVRDLHQAMTMDDTGELQTLVTAFTQAGTVAERDALVTQIIYRWSGVQDIHPASRINSSWNNKLGDGRKLEALEEFLGEEWRQHSWGANPGPDASGDLNEAYNLLKALVHGQLMSQSHLKGLFEQIAWSLDEETQSAIGDLTQVAHTLAGRIEADRDMGLEMLGDFLASLKGLGRLDDVDLDAFKAALLPLGVDVAQTIDIALSNWISNNIPSAGNNLLRGTELDDLIDGKGGNDLIVGRGGNDTLIGGTGNDILVGGAGSDILQGGNGSDTYRFGRGDGHDTITDSSRGADRIELKAGISPDDVRLERVGSYDLISRLRSRSFACRQRLHQFSGTQAKAVRQSPNVVEAQIAFAALNRSHVVRMQVSPVGQHL